MKLFHPVAALVLAAFAAPAAGEIVFEAGGMADPMVGYYAVPGGITTMPGIIMVPGASLSPQVASQMQRARAWSVYRRDNRYSGAGLVFSPAPGYAGYGVYSDRQAVVRGNMSRAHAYRLDYYK
jgi:hypothetical protein